MNTIANIQKAAQSALKAGTAEGCMTREALAREIKAQFGRVDLGTLTHWIGNSVKLGLFNTDTVTYKLKRGITGGIEAVKPKTKRTKKAVPAASQPAAQPAAQA